MSSSIATHIESTPGTCGGKPRIVGTRIRVQDIVIWTDFGDTPDEIVAMYPQLTLANIYAALTYYHDNREQIDKDIQDADAFVEKMKQLYGRQIKSVKHAQNDERDHLSP